MPSLCVVPHRLGDPRVVPCFRWLFFVGMSPSETPGSRSVANTQFFTDRTGLRPSRKVSALPSPSTLRFPWRSPFRGLTMIRIRYNLPTCLPPCRSRPGFHPAYGDFYIRAFGGLVARTAAGCHYQWQLGKFHWRDFLHPLERQLASLQPRSGLLASTESAFQKT